MWNVLTTMNSISEANSHQRPEWPVTSFKSCSLSPNLQKTAISWMLFSFYFCVLRHHVKKKKKHYSRSEELNVIYARLLPDISLIPQGIYRFWISATSSVRYRPSEVKSVGVWMRRRPPDFKANCAVSTLCRRTDRLRRTSVDIKCSEVKQLKTASKKRGTQGLNAKESTLTLILTSV